MDTALFEGTLVESERILYTPSTFARTNLIHLQECGRLKALSPHTSHRENLASYLCFIVLEGSGALEYDQKHYTLSAGDCVFLDCKKSYLHRCSNQLWTLEWAHFYGPNMPGIYEKYTERGGLACFRPQSLAPYQKILDSLCETAASSDYVRDMKIFEQLTALLSLLMQDSWHPGSTAKPTSRKYNLQQIKDYLDFHYPETIRLDDLAETFYINKFYLSRIFKEVTSFTINDYLNVNRIKKAHRLLLETDDSITSIAEQLGYENITYFERVFKKYRNMTPLKYRNYYRSETE